VLGWTCGNAVSSAHDIARFYFELLGPKPSIVSSPYVKLMQTFKTLTLGWASGFIDYGFGLMVQNVSPKQSEINPHVPPPRNATASYIGHAGDTYAFQSDNGFFPAYNASISVVLNQDSEAPDKIITCNVLQVVARHFGSSEDFGCRPIPRTAMYKCVFDVFGQNLCVQSASHFANYNRSECEIMCS